MPRMMSAPTTPSGLARTNPETCSGQVTREARGAVAEEPSSELSIAISVIPDARFEPRVGEIDQQVHDHEAEGDQEHEGLHHRVVAVGDRVDHEAADSVEREDRLGHHQACLLYTSPSPR